MQITFMLLQLKISTIFLSHMGVKKTGNFVCMDFHLHWVKIFLRYMYRHIMPINFFFSYCTGYFLTTWSANLTISTNSMTGMKRKSAPRKYESQRQLVDNISRAKTEYES